MRVGSKLISQEQAPVQAMTQLAFGFLQSRAVYVAAKLGIPDRLREGPRNVRDLAALAEVDPDALFRIMRLLAGSGVFHQDEEGLFFLTGLGRVLCTDTPDSLRDWVILCHEAVYPVSDHILHQVRTGESAFVRQFGNTAFALIQSDPAFAGLFQRGLASRTRHEASAIADAYDFSRVRDVVDVGGGSGSLLSAILARHERLTGILFDLAPAIELAKSQPGWPFPRAEFASGDFFREVPASANLYLLKFVLHDWPDDQAARILATCRRAMDAHSKLLVIEGLLGAANELTPTDFADITMMLMMDRGRERTEAEFSTLLQRSGFALRTVIPTAVGLSILEAVPV